LVKKVTVRYFPYSNTRAHRANAISHLGPLGTKIAPGSGFTLPANLMAPLRQLPRASQRDLPLDLSASLAATIIPTTNIRIMLIDNKVHIILSLFRPTSHHALGRRGKKA
jgi:hypothetical protein